MFGNKNLLGDKMRKLFLLVLIGCMGCEQPFECEDHSRIPDVRNEGREAFKNGVAVTGNPYPSSSIRYKRVFLYAEWNKGYNDAQIEAKNQ